MNTRTLHDRAHPAARRFPARSEAGQHTALDQGINAIISTYADDPRVTYMDIGDKFLQPDGTLTPEIMPDFLHPSTKGYVIWADAIQPVIDKYSRAPSAAAPASPK
jgi:lysophospholipase L1-like esterase